MIGNHSGKDEKLRDVVRIMGVLCKTAKKGLASCYAEPLKLPHTIRVWAGSSVKREGDSIRYAAVSQIGIRQWLVHHPEDKEFMPDIWPAISKRSSEIQGIGDLALCLWAAVDSEKENAETFARLLSKSWPQQSHLCNAVELGWIVQAGTLCMQSNEGRIGEMICPVLRDSHRMLKELFCDECNLFRRHNRGGIREVISRRVACFADQVYPILAMSTFGTTFDDKTSIDFAGRAVEQICRFQGDLGQWQWHYDVPGGKVCEEYPVFSVHQDAMAPMAIIAADKACGVDHTKEIELGMRWLFGANELDIDMVLEDKGIIWRDIKRREPKRFSRMARSLCCVTGMDKLHKLVGGCFDKFIINYECRPYHLGWILYAWADYGL